MQLLGRFTKCGPDRLGGVAEPLAALRASCRATLRRSPGGWDSASALQRWNDRVTRQRLVRGSVRRAAHRALQGTLGHDLGAPRLVHFGSVVSLRVRSGHHGSNVAARCAYAAPLPASGARRPVRRGEPTGRTCAAVLLECAGRPAARPRLRKRSRARVKDGGQEPPAYGDRCGIEHREA